MYDNMMKIRNLRPRPGAPGHEREGGTGKRRRATEAQGKGERRPPNKRQPPYLRVTRMRRE